MRICKDHWAVIRSAIEVRGLSGLVAKDSKEAHKNLMAELEGGAQPPFDPLMSMHWHWHNAALRNGGLYLLSEDPSGKNDGQYCPLCEFVAHAQGFDDKKEIDSVADQILAWCREEGLVPKAARRAQ